MNRFAPTFIGIVSATLAGSLVAQGLRSERTQLIAPEQKSWFERQSPAIQKAVLPSYEAPKLVSLTIRNGMEPKMQ